MHLHNVINIDMKLLTLLHCLIEQALFHIEDGPGKEKEKLFHSDVARRLRDFKAKLVDRWISKTRKPPGKIAHLMPWEVYKGFITQQNWKIFEADHTADEAKAISEKARNNATLNKHHYHLDRKSYKRNREQWINDGGYSTDADISTSRLGKRELGWLLAKEAPCEGGAWAILDDNTQKVAKKYENYMQQAQGTSVPKQNTDALCMALGEKDHRGYVYGVGGLNVGHQKAFAKPDQKSTGSSLDRQSMDKIKAPIKALLLEEFSQKLEDMITIAIDQHLPCMKQQESGLNVSEASNLLQTAGLDSSPPVSEGAKPGDYKEKSKENVDLVALSQGSLHPMSKGHYKELVKTPLPLLATIDYIRDAFLSIRDRGEVGYKLILAPYYEEEHWMLIVINLKCGKVFKFDSSMLNKGRSLAIKDSLDL
ncbi:N-formyl-4-amino-5-aminomethyl-2-methylpyrimidine deformylase [Bienertia sinuspersici]